MFGFKGKSDKNTKETPAEYVDLVIIYSTTDFGLISILKSIFDDEGLTYLFQGENAAHFKGGIPVNLMIKKDQVERAKVILTEILK